MTTDDKITFTVQCTMRKRWAPHFLGMLNKMQWLGSVGSSRRVVFFSDGDGDFRPRFQFPDNIEIAEGTEKEGLFYDAG